MSQKKQPKAPCKHIQELIDFALDNRIAIYPPDRNDECQENVRCYKCKRIFQIDTSDATGIRGGYLWEEIFV